MKLPAHLTDPALAATVHREIEDALVEIHPFSTATAADLDALLAVSGLNQTGRLEVARAWADPTGTAAHFVARRAIQRAHVMEGALSTRDVSRVLGVAGTTVTRKADRGELIAVRGRRNSLLFPVWQFTDEGALPDWDRIAPIVAEADVRAIYTFVTVARESLGGKSVRDWLATHGDVDPVIELAESTMRR